MRRGPYQYRQPAGPGQTRALGTGRANIDTLVTQCSHGLARSKPSTVKLTMAQVSWPISRMQAPGTLTICAGCRLGPAEPECRPDQFPRRNLRRQAARKACAFSGLKSPCVVAMCNRLPMSRVHQNGRSWPVPVPPGALCEDTETRFAGSSEKFPSRGG